MTLSNAILNRKCFLRKDRDILNEVWEIITECPITRAGEGLITNLADMGVGATSIAKSQGGGGIKITPFETRAGSLAALLFCHTVILSLSHSVCLPSAMYVYLHVCLTDFLPSCGHSEQLLF